MINSRLDRLKFIMRQVAIDNLPFDMEGWVTVKFNYEPQDLKNVPSICGTACCAAGYAALDPIFQDEGLFLRVIDEADEIHHIFSFDDIKTLSLRETIDPDYIEVAYDGYTGLAATQAFFEISCNSAIYLFSPHNYPKKEDITPEMVIARIDEVIASDGKWPT
jgi:hypothetical protein